MNTLEKGDKLPIFVLKDQNGIEHKSTDYLGKKIIIFFYPRANTPGCTAEVCDLRDNYELLKVKGYNLILVHAKETGHVRIWNKVMFIDREAMVNT